VSPDLLFWFGFVLKMVLTAAVVVITSVAVERSGPFVGALIGALPTAAGAAYTILALEHPPDFIAASAIGSVAINAAVAIFAATYATLAQRHGLIVSLGGAGVLWLAIAAALRMVDWTPLGAVAVNVLVFAVTIPWSWRYRGSGGRVKFVRTRYDIPLRAHGCVCRRYCHRRQLQHRFVRVGHVRAVPNHSRQLNRDHASADRRQGDGEHAGACAAAADRARARFPGRALSGGADRRLAGAWRRPHRQPGLERLAPRHPHATAKAQRSYFGFASCALSA
jgi:uncharacterized membrane protein (GlpM family)